MGLCELLYAWLPVVHNNSQKIGLNGTKDHLFTLVDALELQTQLLEQLPPHLAETTEKEFQNNPNYHYVQLTACCSNAEAQTLLSELEKANIRFDTSSNHAEVKSPFAIINALTPLPNTPSNGPYVSVFQDDIEQAEIILSQLQAPTGAIPENVIEDISFIQDDLERLAHYCQHDPHLHFYIKHDDSAEWIKTSPYDIDLPRVQAFIVTYPSGNLLDSVNATVPFPESMKTIQCATGDEYPLLTRQQMKKGVLKIAHTACVIHPEDKNFYSTTLTNKTKERIRLTQLAFTCSNPKPLFGPLPTDLEYFETTYYNEAYGITDPFGWIRPGETVTHPYNWSSQRGYWIYFVETESKQQFIAVSPKVGKKPEEQM